MRPIFNVFSSPGAVPLHAEINGMVSMTSDRVITHARNNLLFFILSSPLFYLEQQIRCKVPHSQHISSPPFAFYGHGVSNQPGN